MHVAWSLRPATASDIPGILEIQEPGSIAGIGHIFPQDRYPFPRDTIAERWAAEIADPETFVYVVDGRDDGLVGFAARRGDELMHFGTAVSTWGSGLARELHDALVETYPPDLEALRLFVFEDNRRARRLYEKLGWAATEVTRQTPFPPHPTLIQYLRPRRP